VNWWTRARADLARPEAPTGREELPFLALSAAVVVVLAQLSDPGSTGEVLLVLVAGAAFVLRGVLPRWPSEVFAVAVTVPVGLAVASGHLEVTFFLGVMMTLYAAWHLGSTTRAVAVAAVSAATPWIVSVISTEELNSAAWVSANVFTFVLGRTLRRQRSLIEQLEAAREALADQAVAEERRRIARELHDVAGHTLAAILLHVTGARHVLRRDLDEAERALLDAEAVGRSGLDQIRATVAALRTSERGTDPTLPGSADIAGLVDEYRRAGLTINDDIAPAVAGIEGPVGTALHRISQEALANVARHAPSNRVRITVEADPAGGEVRLVVDNHGRRAAAPDGGGFGLVGMRERARALGGDLDAGPTDDGWRVEARFPVAGRDGAAAADQDGIAAS
jgi:signal transduction histidine kinase